MVVENCFQSRKIDADIVSRYVSMELFFVGVMRSYWVRISPVGGIAFDRCRRGQKLAVKLQWTETINLRNIQSVD